MLIAGVSQFVSTHCTYYYKELHFFRYIFMWFYLWLLLIFFTNEAYDLSNEASS
jgi:hypothetical protein